MPIYLSGRVTHTLPAMSPLHPRAPRLPRTGTLLFAVGTVPVDELGSAEAEALLLLGLVLLAAGLRLNAEDWSPANLASQLEGSKYPVPQA